MSGDLTVAVVGLNFGALWAPLYQLHPDVGRVVLCDPSSEALDRVGAATGITDRKADLADVLADERVDAVHLLTPLHLHAEQALATLRAGKHCAVAVTPALDLTGLEELVRAQQETGLNYMMMETGAYSDAVIHLRDLITSGTFGEVTFARGEHHQDMEGWPGYWVGLPPMWYSIHALAPLLAILGARPVSVRALGSGRLPDDRAATWGNPYPLEIALYALAGSPVSIEVTRSMFQTTRSPVESFSIWGEKHGLDWGRTTDETPLFYSWGTPGPGGRGRTVIAEPFTPPDLSHTVPARLRPVLRHPHNYQGASPRLVHEFVQSIIDGRRPALDAVVAAQWTAAGFAAHESAMNAGAVVEIPAFDVS
ncbi:Gfo/Idh/MocA family protein [Jiangella alkaliphila]|uniref:Predicted dehydrogenase n=1 Tax=Jiangella alkaliphila TaxID=419479 RepID=A0A1H2LEH6_9ACTN|nr:Gfo/Idh/MocA family oxidoreductase [Jiangella alkaliphila]SDU79135.1 Predicted dehydrogenase [Jiangella alkaliphila]